MRNVVGWCLVILGLIGFSVEIDNMRKGATDSSAVGFVLATVFAFGGGALLRSAWRAKQPARLEAQPTWAQHSSRSPRDIERMVLTCAKQHGGRVTIAEVSAESELSFTEAKAVLEELSRAGACTVDVTEHGAFIYEFNGLLPREPRSEASDS